MFSLFAFVFSVIDPVNIGNNKYINKNPIIGACANTESSAKLIMQKLIDTGSVQLDEYNSVFARPDIFSGFTVYTAKVYDGHTIFNFSEVTGTKSGQFRFILDFVWERTKSYAQDFIEATRQVIINAFAALQKAPQYFFKHSVPEKPKSVLIAELKAQNPIKPEVVDPVRVDQVIPINMGNNQHINRNPIIGACSNTEAGAKKIMQKLIDTQHVLLDAYHSVFARSDIFYGFMIHAAKVHEGHTIFTYSQVGDRTGTQYRFILGSVWERTKSYTQDFIEATRQVITTAFSALKEAPGYFAKTPAPAKSTTEAIDQFSTHLDQVWQEHTKVRSWSADQIKSWKEHFVQQPTGRRNIHEMVAVLMRAAELSHGHIPRNTQLVSVLACLCQSGRGRFLQVKTGEGKSLITAMLAASKHLLEDIPVDVLSSSEILAERDATAQQKFYGLLSIQAGFKKKNKGRRDEGVEEFYRTHPIIYSDISELVFDDLKQSYQGKPTRGNRPFAALIVDEVDSLLVDRISMICKLSTDLDCSESLLPFMQLLWLKLEELEKTVVRVGNIYQHVLSKEPIANKELYITRELEAFCLEILEGKQGQIQLPMPKFLKDFARFQTPRWVQSVQRAKSMTEKKDYVYSKNDDPEEPGKIKIVDYEHTGVVQDGMQWSDGLHQFLGIKHDGCIEPESLTSCFLSTLGFLSKYKNNVFGLTGTLGDDATRKFIEEVYGVSLLDIPTYKPKQFKEMPGVLCEGQSAWEDEVLKNVDAEIQKGRAVLVINETIGDCDSFEAALKSACPQARVRKYDRNDRKDSEAAVSKIVQPGDVILATNLGGRGTDVGTSPLVELNGGLHVIVTFLPMNQRVEDQAFGRTSRQGKLGTAQLIVDKERTRQSLYPFVSKVDTIEDLRTMRQQKEEARIGQIRQHGIANSQLNDRLFYKMNDYVKRLLGGTPLHKHDDQEKIKQVDQLWALLFHRISHYKENLYRKWGQELMDRLHQFDLLPSRGFGGGVESSLHSLYEVVPFSIDPQTLRHFVLSFLLRKKPLWKDAELEQFCHQFVDTRQAPDALLEAMCQITQSTYVCMDHSGHLKIFRHQKADAPVICLGRIAAYPVSQTEVPLNILSELYHQGASRQPALDAAQLPSSVCYAYHPEHKVHPALQQRIQGTRPITAELLTPESLLLFLMQPRHPLLERVLTRMAQMEEAKSKQLWQKEEAFLDTVAQGFITDLNALYARENDIIIAPASLSKRAKRNDQPEVAFRLFERAIASDSLYSAVACYDWANYVIRHPGKDYKKVAEEKLKRCEQELQKMVMLWQYIAVFSEDSSAHNPIGQQVKGRMEFYGHMLANIQQNLATIAQSGTSDSIRITSEDAMEDLMKRMVHLKHRDSMQLMNQGLHGLDVYSAISPEPSIWESIMVSVLGVVQTVVGCLLTASGIPLGASIIVAGLQDLWRAGKALVTGKFSWESYWFDKGIDVLTIGISHAYSAIKNNITAAHQAVTAAAKQAAQTTQQVVMDTLIRGAKEVLVKSFIAELSAKAVNTVVSGFKEDMEKAVEQKVIRLLGDQTLCDHLCHMIVMAYMIEDNSPYQTMIQRIQQRMQLPASQACQIINRLTKACAAHHSSGTSLMGMIAHVSAGVGIARYAHDVMTCVDTYIQYLREEIIQMSRGILDIAQLLKSMYPQIVKKQPSPQTNVQMGTFVTKLAAQGLLVGNRPYLAQRSAGFPGFNQDQTVEQMAYPTVMAMQGLTLTVPEQQDLAEVTLQTIQWLRDYPESVADMVKKFQKIFIDFGAGILFEKTVTVTNEVIQQGVSVVQGMLSKLRTSTQKMLRDHEQQQEGAEQERIAAQRRAEHALAAAKRTEQAKVAAAQQKARQEAAAEAARRAALEKDTAYTRTLARYLQSGQSDSSAVLRGYYRDVAIATNRNRARTKSPPRSSDTFGHRAGSTVITHTPVIVKEVIGSGLQAISRVIEWSAEMFPRTAAVVGNALNAVDHVTAEVPSTHTRRTLRDRLGAPQGIAQDVGDVVGFAVGMFIPGKAGKTVMNVSRAVAGVSDAAKAVRVANTTTSEISRVVASTEQVASGNMTRMAAGSAAIKRSSSAVRIREKSVWQELPLTRGEMIEEALGKNLHRQFPTIDSCFVENQTAISIKSRDLHLPTYQNPSTLASRVKMDIDKVASFERGQVGKEVRAFGTDFTKRELTLAIPEGISAQQLDTLKQMERYATEKGVQFNVVSFA